MNVIREYITNQAYSLFLNMSYEAVSMRELSKAVGLTKRALYFHFRNKEEMLIFPGVIVASQLQKISEIGISLVVFISCFILSGSGILTFRLLKKQELNKAIISLGTGILLSVFIISFSIPRYNKYIGLKEICNQAKETASEKSGVNYYFCEMTIADNLNAYLEVMPEKLRIS